ncbi:glucose-6-phosphate dehydrogenase [Streptomyces gobiensis]|uniref:glucose-6-phosphate dehydrogenase n=1 Tax=Streptomyces gobiensis TaxID=2875706 RepID=UPI001E3F54C3|nr:glucose-6-phosphate dehydrogenase [Streptomyces gobiensis]UGY94470.1 glucose-6-phosphate dehydrogenase [Streptomyces gobiensis]
MTTLVLCGATGDLAGRYLYPALTRLADAGELPDEFRMRGVSREELTDEEFKEHLRTALDEHAPQSPRAAREELAARCEYIRADVTDTDGMKAATERAEGPCVIYLALPPSLYQPAVRSLAKAGPPTGSSVVFEKPFAEGQESARELNGMLAECLAEERVFRVDHFLNKQTVQNILGLRFANRLFEPVWNAGHIERVDIVWDEDLTLEGRAGYYDQTGALRDMVQNHLLQLLCLIAMDPPHSLHERELRDRKVQLLRAVRGPSAAEAAEGDGAVRARYTAGTVAGRKVPDYTDEPGVDPARGTETYAELRLAVDNWRWAGVPFLLRTGKALGEPRTAIDIRFKPVPHLAFGQSGGAVPNLLRLSLDPERIDATINLNGAGDPFELESAQLGLELAPQRLPAYARLLLDIFRGDPSLTIRGDEAEECWRVVDPVLAAWENGRAPLPGYPAGSAGPSAA